MQLKCVFKKMKGRRFVFVSNRKMNNMWKKEVINKTKKIQPWQQNPKATHLILLAQSIAWKQIDICCLQSKQQTRYDLTSKQTDESCLRLPPQRLNMAVFEISHGIFWGFLPTLCNRTNWWETLLNMAHIPICILTNLL